MGIGELTLGGLFRSRSLRKNTQAFLERTFDGEWFGSVGEPINGDVCVLASWEEAVETIAESEGFFVRRRNDLTSFLFEHALRRYKEWNHIAALVESETRTEVNRRIDCLTEIDEEHKDAIRARTYWSISNACMEVEYGDILEPGFYFSLVQGFCDGHFPCGYVGDFPNGSAVLY